MSDRWFMFFEINILYLNHVPNNNHDIDYNSGYKLWCWFLKKEQKCEMFYIYMSLILVL